MNLLTTGVLIWSITHFSIRLAPGVRTGLIERGAFSLSGFVLVTYGGESLLFSGGLESDGARRAALFYTLGEAGLVNLDGGCRLFVYCRERADRH